MRAPARHSFSQLARPPELAISGVRIQKLPLTLRPPLFAAPGANSWLSNSVFGSVSQDTYRQALLEVGPFMVELFTAAGFARSPRAWSTSGSDCHQPKAPHAGTRSADLSLPTGPKPVGGFAGPMAAHRLRDMTAPMPMHRGVSASPPFRVPAQRRRHGSKSLSDRTLRLISDLQSQRVYFNEPPSSTDKPLSWHPALLAQHMMVGETIPLACW